MIANLNTLATLQLEWHGVIRLRERIRRLATSTLTYNGCASPTCGIIENILYNLPFLLAFDVLKKVLLEACDEGLFASSQHHLGDLMEGAKTSLTWINWQSLREAVRRRNEFTQGTKLYGDIQCLQDIADIEAQLTAWGIVPTSRGSQFNPDQGVATDLPITI